MFATVHTWSIIPYKVLWKQSWVSTWTRCKYMWLPLPQTSHVVLKPQPLSVIQQYALKFCNSQHIFSAKKYFLPREFYTSWSKHCLKYVNQRSADFFLNCWFEATVQLFNDPVPTKRRSDDVVVQFKISTYLTCNRVKWSGQLGSNFRSPNINIKMQTVSKFL